MPNSRKGNYEEESPGLSYPCFVFRDTKMNMQMLYDAESEHDFQQKVVDYALIRGWYVHAVLDTWIPAKRLGQTGFPDLVLARGKEMKFIECKSEKGKPSLAQLAWADVIVATGNTYRLWKPHMWDEIEKELA